MVKRDPSISTLKRKANSNQVVLITGVSGRIGSSLALHFARSGYHVRGVLRPGGNPLHATLRSKIETVEASLTDLGALARAVAGAHLVLHFAAQMPMNSTAVDEYFDINVTGTLRLLEASVEHKVRRFILASTDNTYCPSGPQLNLLSEDAEQIPGDYYGTAKVLCERLIENIHKLHGLEYAILRLGSVVAPNESPSLFRLQWVRNFLGAQARAGRRSNLWRLFSECPDPVGHIDAVVGLRDDNPAVVLDGPDGAPWSIHLTDVRDVVTGTALAICESTAANQHFNIVGPRTTTFHEGAEVLVTRCGLRTVRIAMPMKLAFELSTAKAARLLGYRPRWDFDGMVATALSAPGETPHDYVPAGGA